MGAPFPGYTALNVPLPGFGTTIGNEAQV